ncbi:hypothetical protein LCGC14_1296100 [marine sediment metagenome]|uniref:Uncharacterized protein n=1 Tax=marine sediment metagenome TaxID=412755 RepID=A0A0F9NTU1_9ZZZZ
MHDYEIAKKIRADIKLGKIGILEVIIQNFVNLWFRGKQFTNKGFTKKLMSFAKTYDFGYVIILNGHKQGVAIRFWEKKSQIELGKKHNEL